MMLAVPTHRISSFHFSRSENLLTAEMSDLGRHFQGRIYNDACDVGFRIQGARQTVLYTLIREDRDRDGDLHSVVYAPCTDRGTLLPDFPKVVLFND